MLGQHVTLDLKTLKKNVHLFLMSHDVLKQPILNVFNLLIIGVALADLLYLCALSNLSSSVSD
jgi:hypothetical protein